MFTNRERLVRALSETRAGRSEKGEESVRELEANRSDTVHILVAPSFVMTCCLSLPIVCEQLHENLAYFFIIYLFIFCLCDKRVCLIY